MKQEVSQPLVIGIVVVVVIAVAIIGWKMFAPSAGASDPTKSGSGSADARAQHFKDHPGDKAVWDSMNKGVASPSGATNSSAGHMPKGR